MDSVTAEVWPGQVKLARCSRNSDQISWMPTEMRWKPQMVVTVAAPRRMQGMSVILDDFQTIWMIFRQIWMTSECGSFCSLEWRHQNSVVLYFIVGKHTLSGCKEGKPSSRHVMMDPKFGGFVIRKKLLCDFI